MSFGRKISWSSRPLRHPDAKRGLEYHTAALVGGTVLVYGGFQAQTGSIYYYTLSTHSWKQLTVQGLEYRYGHTTVLVEDGIYLIGGGRKTGGFKGPIERLDLITHAIEPFDLCKSSQDCSVYVESRRDIVMVAAVSEDPKLGCDICCFDVDSKRFTTARLNGPAPVLRRYDTKLIESRGIVYLLTQVNRSCAVFVVQFTGAFSVKLSQVKLSAAFPFYVRNMLQMVDHIIVCFGGKNRSARGESDEMFTVDTRTGIVTKTSGRDTASDLVYEGAWPAEQSGTAGVVSKGKLLIFGGKPGRLYTMERLEY